MRPITSRTQHDQQYNCISTRTCTSSTAFPQWCSAISSRRSASLSCDSSDTGVTVVTWQLWLRPRFSSAHARAQHHEPLELLHGSFSNTEHEKVIRYSSTRVAMDLLNSYDDDETPNLATTDSFVSVRSVNAGVVHMLQLLSNETCSCCAVVIIFFNTRILVNLSFFSSSRCSYACDQWAVRRWPMHEDDAIQCAHRCAVGTSCRFVNFQGFLFFSLYCLNVTRITGPVNPYNPRRGLAAANHFIGHVEVCVRISHSPSLCCPDSKFRWMVSMATRSMNSVWSLTELVCRHYLCYGAGLAPFFVSFSTFSLSDMLNCNQSLAGVAMDPSQGNTSGLVMTNHLYRLVHSLVCLFWNLIRACVQFHSGRHSDEVACQQKDKGTIHNLITFSAVFFLFIWLTIFSLCCQAHDIIVVELAPPPPREVNEETDPALDPDAAVIAVIPKVAEKKKVWQWYLLFVVREYSFYSSIQEPESHSTLHIKKEHERDYMGRSWLEAIPADLRFTFIFCPSCRFGRFFVSFNLFIQGCGWRRHSWIISTQDLRSSVGGTHEGRAYEFQGSSSCWLHFRVSTAFDGYQSGVICYWVLLSITLSRSGMCMPPSRYHWFTRFFLNILNVIYILFHQ